MEQKQKQKILILRGKPGSGKTTIVDRFFRNDRWVSVSADHFFTDERGVYNFQPHLIQTAHDAAYDKAVKALSEGKNVVVDNTNRTLWEFERYVKLASPSVEIRVVRRKTYFGSTKPVPQHIIDRYDREYERYPGEGEIDIVQGKLVFK